MTSCIPCLGGSFCPPGANSMTPCPAGSFCPSGVGSPDPCPAGSFCPAGVNSPTPCLAGSYSGTGAPLCTQCPSGYFSNSGASACSGCSPGSFSNNPGSPSCTLCSAGTLLLILPQLPAQVVVLAPSGEYRFDQLHSLSWWLVWSYFGSGGLFKLYCRLLLPLWSKFYDSLQPWTVCGCFLCQLFLCPAGYYCPLSATANPEPCTPGTYSSLRCRKLRCSALLARTHL
jgi:hypothetical protein